VQELTALFAGVGMTAKVIGAVDNERTLRIRYDGDETQVFDFINNGIMHLTLEDVGCQSR
jgi:hypothetical protein